MDVQRIRDSLTSEDLQRLLSLLTARSGLNSSTETSALLDGEVGEDDDDPDYIDEEEDEEDEEEEVGYNAWGSARPWDRRKWWPKVTKPEKQGLELLFGGEFGRAQHQINTRNGNHNVARNLLLRGQAPQPTHQEDIASVGDPAS